MKVGILSMQRIYNYGSFLQAFALKSLLEKRGHEVCFVDIESKPNHSYLPNAKAQRFNEKIRHFDKYFFCRLKYSKKNRELNHLFYQQQKLFLELNDHHMISEGYDAIVIGSDEIFNCSSKSMWGVTRQRFGEIKHVPIVLSYAASCGNTGLKDVAEEDKTIIKNALKCMDRISVRDQNTREFIKAYTDQEPEVNLDPVLLYDFKEEMALGEREGVPDAPYMIVYAYRNRIESKMEIDAIQTYARQKGWKTIAIGGSQPWCDEFAVISPFQVLAYFKYAKCVVTDTFHGTVFSAMLNKPLAVLVRDSNKNKLEDLLKRLHIEQHKVSDIDQLDRIMRIANNYDLCNKIIEHEQQHACEYLGNIGL